MKFVILILSSLATATVVHAEGSVVWYDASGNVLKVAATEKGKKSWVPTWKKKELARQGALAARRSDRLSPRVSRYFDSPHPHYYGGLRCHYGYSQYSFSRQGYFGGPWLFKRAGYSPARPGFSGLYRGSGWSVRWRN